MTKPEATEEDTGQVSDVERTATGSDSSAPVASAESGEKKSDSAAAVESTASSATRESSDETSDSVTTGAANRTEPGSRWSTPVKAVAALAVVALIAAVTFGVLWGTDDSADRLAALQGRLDTEAAAEDAASRYAMNVSEVDFRDLEKWRAALTDGASEQLAPKLESAVDVVGPWLTQMEYTASARLLAAQVSKVDGDNFVVQVFVDMTSKSKQAPDGVGATATYTVTMDRASDWTITDVGGVGAGLPGTEGQAPGPGGPAPAPAPAGSAPAPGAGGR